MATPLHHNLKLYETTPRTGRTLFWVTTPVKHTPICGVGGGGGRNSELTSRQFMSQLFNYLTSHSARTSILRMFSPWSGQYIYIVRARLSAHTDWDQLSSIGADPPFLSHSIYKGTYYFMGSTVCTYVCTVGDRATITCVSCRITCFYQFTSQTYFLGLLMITIEFQHRRNSPTDGFNNRFYGHTVGLFTVREWDSPAALRVQWEKQLTIRAACSQLVWRRDWWENSCLWAASSQVFEWKAWWKNSCLWAASSQVFKWKAWWINSWLWAASSQVFKWKAWWINSWLGAASSQVFKWKAWWINSWLWALSSQVFKWKVWWINSWLWAASSQLG